MCTHGSPDIYTEGVYIRQTTRVHGITNTLTPQIKGNHRAAGHMFPSVPGLPGNVVYVASPLGQYHDIAQESGILFI